MNKSNDDMPDDLRQLLCFNFYLGWRAIQAYYKPNFEPGMTSQRIYALSLCETDRPVKMTDIAEALEIDLPAVSSLIDRMASDGLVNRRRSRRDRRAVEVWLTKKGETARELHNQRLQEADVPLFAQHIRASDLKALRRIVEGVNQAAKAQRETP